MSSLRLISQTTVAAGLSNIDITDVFTDDFDVYKIVVTGIQGSANARQDVYLLDSGGNVISGDFNNATLEMKGDTGYNEQKHTSLSYWKNMGYSSANGAGGFVMHLFNPFNASKYTHYISESYGGFTGDSSTHDNITNRGQGVLKDATTVAGIRIAVANTTAGTLGKVAIYGYGMEA